MDGRGRGAPASRWRSALAAAALVVLSLGTSWLSHRHRHDPVQEDPWRIASMLGVPTLDAAPAASQGRVGTGRWLETDTHSSAVLDVGRIGRLNVAPHSRLRLLRASSDQHRVELVRGTIEAFIWAPPGRFVVETSSATAVDLGCAYTLSVDDEGRGTLSVSAGWVGFEHRGRESFIPAGASGRTYPGIGPGTPTFDEAPAALRDAVARLDVTEGSHAQEALLAVVLHEARPDDAFTLWHLIDRVDPVLAPRVVDALHRVVPRPDGVTRAGVLAGDRAMRDHWWEALGLGSASWWRSWRQEWGAR